MNYIGIDLGGTNIKGALVSAEGEILKEHSIPTRVDLGPAIDEKSCRRRVPAGCRLVKRCHAVVGAGIDVRPAVEQQLRDVGLRMICCTM